LYSKSRVRGDFQARFCERLRVKLPLPTRCQIVGHNYKYYRMDDIIIKIAIGLAIGLLGLFLRDVYNYVKRKFIKSKKPKVVLEYEVTAKGAHSSNPRIYEFRSNLLIQNIDTIPVYNLRVIQNLNSKSKEIFRENYLSPNEKKEIKKEIEVPFGKIGTNYEEAKQVIPEDFKQPDLVLKFEDSDGHNYSKIVVIK